MSDDPATAEQRRHGARALPDRRRSCSTSPRRTRSRCTACPRIPARRSPTRSCTATASGSGIRPRTAVTRRRRCSSCCIGWASGASASRHEQPTHACPETLVSSSNEALRVSRANRERRPAAPRPPHQHAQGDQRTATQAKSAPPRPPGHQRPVVASRSPRPRAAPRHRDAARPGPSSTHDGQAGGDRTQPAPAARRRSSRRRAARRGDQAPRRGDADPRADPGDARRRRLARPGDPQGRQRAGRRAGSPRPPAERRPRGEIEQLLSAAAISSSRRPKARDRAVDRVVRGADRARRGRRRPVVPDPRLRRPERRPGPEPARRPVQARAAQGADLRAQARQPQVGHRRAREGDRVAGSRARRMCRRLPCLAVSGDDRDQAAPSPARRRARADDRLAGLRRRRRRAHRRLRRVRAGAVPGDRVRAVDRQAQARLRRGAQAIEILEPSPDRIAPLADHPGAPWQVLPYERQLEVKQAQVDDALRRIGKLDGYELEPIVPAVAAVALPQQARVLVRHRRGRRAGVRLSRPGALGRDRRRSTDCLLASERGNEARERIVAWCRAAGADGL